jgi:DNA-binding transcriptional LysR family regulator
MVSASAGIVGEAPSIRQLECLQPPLAGFQAPEGPEVPLSTRSVNWDDLRFVLAIHRHGSVAAAARALKVDPSTIGRRIAALEGELGAQLVVRHPDGMKFTDAGHKAVVAAEAVDASIAELACAVGGAAEQPRGHVRVSATDGFATLLYGGLAALREDYPEIIVDLVVSSTAVDLARGEADIAIRAFRETRGDLVARKVCDVGWSLYASTAYLARKPPAEDPCDLRGHDVIGFADVAQRTPGARWMEENARGASIVFRATSTTAAMNAARAGMGIAIVPCFTADPSVMRITPRVVASSEVFLVTTAESKAVARVRIVCNALANLFATDKATLAG